MMFEMRSAESRRSGAAARIAAGLLVGAALFASAGIAAAQSFPVKPIRLIVPYAPGGSADILARTIGTRLGERLAQPVVIDHRPGAGTIIGTEATAKAAPDGHTFMLGTISSHAINPAFNTKLPFDPVRDFTPISLVASIPFVMLVHPSVPAKDVQEFVALARAQPGKHNYASAGNGTSNHLAGELLKSLTGIDIVHVPYKGSAPALTDLLGGQVSLMFDLALTALPHLKSGAARGLAVTSTQRSPVVPLPPVAESVPGYEIVSWFGMIGPAGIPPAVVQKLNAELVHVMQLPDVRERLASQGATALSSTPEAYAAYLKDEIAKWAKVVRGAGMKIN